MTKLTKFPPFILAQSRDGENEYIVHTKEPRFIAKIFTPSGEAEESELLKAYPKLPNLTLASKKYVFGLTIWQPYESDKLSKIVSRMTDWYKSYLIDKSTSQESAYKQTTLSR
jgi:hypothetical protein